MMMFAKLIKFVVYAIILRALAFVIGAAIIFTIAGFYLASLP